MSNTIEQVAKVTRKWTDLDSKVKAMLASGFTVGGVQEALVGLGWNAPHYLVILITIAAIFVASYFTKSTVKLTDESGSVIDIDTKTAVDSAFPIVPELVEHLDSLATEAGDALVLGDGLAAAPDDDAPKHAAE